MNDPLIQIEQRLASTSANAPPELRAMVLAGVNRELKSSQWDRRLARAAALLLTMGVALNAVMAFGLAGLPHAPTQPTSSERLLQTAVTVARATDAETGRKIARQIAAWSGHTMTSEQLDSLDAALDAELSNGKEG